MTKPTILILCFISMMYNLHSQNVYVAGNIFIDKNDNGTQDAGEQSIADEGVQITLELVSETNEIVATTLSDAIGFYYFEVEPGNYYIQFVPPVSYPISSSLSNPNDDDQNGDDNGLQEDTDGDMISDGLISSGLFNLSQGGEPINEDGMSGDIRDEDFNSTLDFGLTARLGIGGSVFIDQNNNGLFDPEEDNLGEKDVQAQVALYDTSDQLLQTTFTDDEGQYEFIIKTGDYYIGLIPPADFPTSSSITSTIDDNVSGDDNGSQEDTDGDGMTDGRITSPIINVQTGDEPLGELSLSISDENSNNTIDFGLLDPTDSTIETQSTSINIYPNPISDILTIHTELLITSLEILNQKGQLIRKMDIPSFSKKLDVDITTVHSGHYIVLLKADNKIYTTRFIKL